MCNWKCSEPTNCPKPECTLHCETAKGCMKIEENLPPLDEGMAVVDMFDAESASDATTAAPAAAEANTTAPAAALLQQAARVHKDSKAKIMSTPIYKAVKDPVTKEVKLVREEHPLTLP